MYKTNECIICGNKHPIIGKAILADFLKDRMFDDMNANSDLLYCPNCGIYHSTIRANDEEMVRYYQNYMNTEYINHRSKYEPEGMEWWLNYCKTTGVDEKHREKKYLYDLIRKNTDLDKITNILDFGGSDGSSIPDEFSDKNRYVYDIDSIQPLEGINKISKEELKNYSWDLIISSQMLEHVSNPMKIINEMLEILPEGGYLCINVPCERLELDSVNICKDIQAIHEHINLFRVSTFDYIFESPKYLVIENKCANLYESLRKYGNDGMIICLVKKLTKKERESYTHLILKYLNSKKRIIKREVTKFKKLVIILKKVYILCKMCF